MFLFEQAACVEPTFRSKLAEVWPKMMDKSLVSLINSIWHF